MNKKHLNLVLIFLSIVVITILIIKYQNVPLSIIDTLKIFLNRVFPFLFIMMIFNKLLIAWNLPYYLSKICPNLYVYIFIFSALGGAPINAIIIKELLENQAMNLKEANLALSFSTLNNPLFLYAYMNLIFKDIKIIFLLFLIIYLSNIIILIYCSFKQPIKNKTIFLKKKFNISESLVNAISESITNLIKIFATIAFFKLISDILLPNNVFSVLPKGLLEITQGLNALTNINMSPKVKELLFLVILSFSGLSIHIQISSVLKNYQINYKNFYISRLILIIFSITIIFFNT